MYNAPPPLDDQRARLPASTLLYAWWVLANTLAWSILIPLAEGVRVALVHIASPFWLSGLGPVVTGLIFGSLSGLAQWAVLRQRLHDGSWWIAASAAGWGSGLLAGNQIRQLVTLTSSSLALGLTAGLFLGVAQWLVLRQQLRGAGWWLILSPLLWGLVLRLGSQLRGLEAGIAIGMVSGTLSGIPLLWLLGQGSGSTDPQPGASLANDAASGPPSGVNAE